MESVEAPEATLTHPVTGEIIHKPAGAPYPPIPRGLALRKGRTPY